MNEDICCHIGAGSGIFLPHISSLVRARSNRHRPEPERRTCRPPAGGKTRHTLGFGSHQTHGRASEQLQTWRRFIHPSAGDQTNTNRFTQSFSNVRERKRRCWGTGSGDTHTEDVQAHRPFNALLVGEVILGELMNRCGENTHGMGRVGQSGWMFGGGFWGGLVGVFSLV